MFEKEAEKYAEKGGLSKEKYLYGLKAMSFKDGAEFGYNKAKEEMQEQGLALQSDMDKTIEQNIQLKKQIEKVTKEELKEQDIRLNRLCFDYQEKEKRIAELEKELEQAKKVQVVEHFEAYGQCRDSRRIASLEKENAELKERNYKTKVALRNVIDYLGQFCSDYPDCVIEAERFLKEIKEND